MQKKRMEGNKKKGTSSSSSHPSEIFGSKESQQSSGIFVSLFSTPSPKVLGRESLRNELNAKSSKEAWRSKIGAQDGIYKGNIGESQNTVNKDKSSLYQDQRIDHPCHLSSSIYYGGQDIYYSPQSSQNARLNTSYKNDVGEDDSGSATRGNWWQGGLYY